MKIFQTLIIIRSIFSVFLLGIGHFQYMSVVGLQQVLKFIDQMVE